MTGLASGRRLISQFDRLFEQNWVYKGEYEADGRATEYGDMLPDQVDIRKSRHTRQCDIPVAGIEVERLIALPGETPKGTEALKVDFLAGPGLDPLHSFGREERDPVNRADISETETSKVQPSKVRT